MKIILGIITLIGTGFFSGYIFLSNKDLSNYLYIFLYFGILTLSIILLIYFFFLLIRIFGYDGLYEKINIFGYGLIAIGILCIWQTINFINSEYLNNKLKDLANKISNHFEIKKGEKPIIDLSSNIQTGTTK